MPYFEDPIRSISNTFFHQAEVTQVDRRDRWPLERAFLSEPATNHLGGATQVHDWNPIQQSAFVRPGGCWRG